MLEESLLDCLSRTLYRRVLERFAEWISFAEITGDDVSEGRSILFKVPQPGSDRFLWVSTEGDEVTISFDKWHCHESAWLEDEEPTVDANIARRSIELIDDILSESEVVVVRFQNGTWTGSTLQAATEIVEPASGEVVHVLSWRGTFNRLVSA